MIGKIHKKLSTLSSQQLRSVGLIFGVVTVLITGSVFTLREKQSHAQDTTYDSSVQIRVVGYSGAISVTSTNHAFGDCNNGPGESFSAPVTCNGYQFGPPDWVYIYLPAAPAGTTFAGWSLVSEYTDTHSVGCSTTSCSFNFNSGSAIVQATFTPGSFSASGHAASTTSIALNWSAAGNASSYQVRRNGTQIASVGSTNYTDNGLTCGTSYSYQIFASNAGGSTGASNNPFRIATQNCPLPPPSPQPTPTPSPKPSPNPTPSQNNNPSTQQPAASNSNTDTTPPSTPGNFQTTSEEGKTYVDISWEASQDDGGVKGYELDRSTDQQNWTNLKSNFNDTSFQDDTTTFNTRYFYRLRAVDNSNNFSEYATNDVTTPNFAGNVTSDQEATIQNDAKTITITIPAGAISDNAQCAIISDESVLSPNIDGYRLVDGPDQLLCKKTDGSVIDQFSKPLKVEWKLIPPKGISGLKYYVYKDNNWQVLATNTHNSKTHIDTFTLNNGTTFVAMGKIKHTSPILKILLIIFALGLLVFGALAYIYRRNRSKQLATLDDYWRKIHGG